MPKPKTTSISSRTGQDSRAKQPAARAPREVPGKRKAFVKSAALRTKESGAKVARHFELVRKIPGYEHLTKAEILIAAQRMFQSTSFQNAKPLLHCLLQTYLVPLHYSIGDQISVAELRERFYSTIEQTNVGIAEQLRQPQEVFDWYTLGRLGELQSAAENSRWAIKLLEIVDDRPKGPCVYKVNLKNGKAFLCDPENIACLEPHAGFSGEKSLHVHHADAILKFSEATGDEIGDLRFDLSSRDKVTHLTLLNVALEADTGTVELLIRSAITSYLDNVKKLG
jgi:hypothetical protein